MLPDLKDYTIDELFRLWDHYKSHVDQWDVGSAVRLWQIDREMREREGLR